MSGERFRPTVRTFVPSRDKTRTCPPHSAVRFSIPSAFFTPASGEFARGYAIFFSLRGGWVRRVSRPFTAPGLGRPVLFLFLKRFLLCDASASRSDPSLFVSSDNSLSISIHPSPLDFRTNSKTILRSGPTKPTDMRRPDY